MTDTTNWLPRFDAWATEPTQRLPAPQVHKQDARNVFVARMEPVGPEDPDAYAVQLTFPLDHPYFFEHPVDHVPGLALIEAGRQAGLATAHRYYGVPLDGFTFFIQDLHASFSRFAELDRPVFGRSVVTDIHTKRERLVRMTSTGHYLQGGVPIGTLTGVWNVVPNAVMTRMRRGEGAVS